MISKNTDTSPSEQAWRYALRLLAGRDYSTAKLRAKLTNHGISEEASEVALSRLTAEGWLNDLRFAERFAESAITSGRFRGVRLRQELHRRGVPGELVDDVVRRSAGTGDEVAEIRALLMRKFPGFLFSSAGDREKRRVTGFFLRRGFGVSSIMRALRAYGTEECDV